MKLNKFICQCGQEFYDSNAWSKCDACGTVIYLASSKPEPVDVRIVEAYKQNGDRIRDVIERISETVTTRKR